MIASLLWQTLPPHFSDGIPDENKWSLIRNYRNELLAKSDWTQLPDIALTLEEKQLWAAYRQDLRDLTQTFVTPDQVIFPEVPGENR